MLAESRCSEKKNNRSRTILYDVTKILCTDDLCERTHSNPNVLGKFQLAICCGEITSRREKCPLGDSGVGVLVDNLHGHCFRAHDLVVPGSDRLRAIFLLNGYFCFLLEFRFWVARWCFFRANGVFCIIQRSRVFG